MCSGLMAEDGMLFTQRYPLVAYAEHAATHAPHALHAAAAAEQPPATAAARHCNGAVVNIDTTVFQTKQ